MGVKLTITHDGFDHANSEMLHAVRSGWVMILSNLKTLLENGTWLADEPAGSSR